MKSKEELEKDIKHTPIGISIHISDHHPDLEESEGAQEFPKGITTFVKCGYYSPEASLTPSHEGTPPVCLPKPLPRPLVEDMLLSNPFFPTEFPTAPSAPVISLFPEAPQEPRSLTPVTETDLYILNHYTPTPIPTDDTIPPHGGPLPIPPAPTAPATPPQHSRPLIVPGAPQRAKRHKSFFELMNERKNSSDEDDFPIQPTPASARRPKF